jgi:GWxTD domain-containing protein
LEGAAGAARGTDRLQIDREKPMPYNKSVKNKAFTLALLFLVLAASLAAGAAPQKKKTAKDLPVQYRKWVEEDVVYIITPKEKEVFLQLESDRERNIFVEAFWKQRDPDPSTPENEFKIEHLRRIAYANQWFGRDTPGAGWRTEMGRIYILLGEPKAKEAYENLYDVKPTVVWFYEGMAELGLPTSFNVVFFKRDINTEYRLYSPINDGPQSLLTHYDGDMASYEQAYNQLVKIQGSLAETSLSLVPGESRMSLTPSIASEILIRQRIPAAPYEKVKDDYAEKLLRYKDIVEVDYSANYIPCDALIDVFQDPAGISYVHYVLEPSRLSFAESDGRYRADLIVNGKVSDLQGNTVYQFDRDAPLRLDQAQFGRIRALPFSFQDLFPMTPGRYKINILWKNAVSKEFSSAEAEVVVPEPGAFSMSQPVLAYKIDRESKYRGSNKSYLVGGVQMVPTPKKVFIPAETMSVCFQIQNPPEDLRRSGRIELTIWKDAQQITSRVRALGDALERGFFLEEFPLTGLGAANYLLQIAVLNADGTQRLSSRVPFGITPLPDLRRPFVLSLPLPGSDDPAIANILGSQYFLKKDLAKARPLLERAYRRDPGSPKYALDFCRLLFASGEFAAVRSTAAPFQADERRFEFLQILGDASKALGDYAQAIVHYKDSLIRFGTNIPILNAVGECYTKTGDVAQALIAYEKSLELDPKQESIRTLVRSLKEKK